MRFRHRVRVQYIDTNQGGVVHHAAYLRFMEAARIELLRERGIDYRRFEIEERKGLPVTEVRARYKRPARFDDVLDVEIGVGVVNRAKIRFDYRIWREEELLCEARDHQRVRAPGRRAHLLDGPADPGRVRVRAAITLAGLSLAGLGLCIQGCTCEGPRTDIPVYRAPRASSPPTIDGRLDDAAWRDAPSTQPFVNTMTGDPAGPRTSAKITWDAENLYVAFEVEDDFLKSELSGHDPHLWEQDTVEIMVDPDGDGRNYFELQLSPTEQVFDTRYDSRRVPQPFGHTDWDSGMRGATVVRGTVNDDGDDEGYTAELAIPWSAFYAGSPPANPPAAGDTWRVALYVLDARRQGQGGVGWSPPLVGDFHVPERFGRVVFEAP